MTLNAAHEATETLTKAVEASAEPAPVVEAPKPRRTRKPAVKAEPAEPAAETKHDPDDVDAIRKKLEAVLNDPNKAMFPTPKPEETEEDVCENHEEPPVEVDKPAAPVVAAAQPAADPVAETPAPAMTQAEKLAAIRAKMAALKNK